MSSSFHGRTPMSNERMSAPRYDPNDHASADLELSSLMAPISRRKFVTVTANSLAMLCWAARNTGASRARLQVTNFKPVQANACGCPYCSVACGVLLSFSSSLLRGNSEPTANGRHVLVFENCGALCASSINASPNSAKDG